jgi:hypothetical protein
MTSWNFGHPVVPRLIRSNTTASALRFETTEFRQFLEISGNFATHFRVGYAMDCISPALKWDKHL